MFHEILVKQLASVACCGVGDRSVCGSLKLLAALAAQTQLVLDVLGRVCFQTSPHRGEAPSEARHLCVCWVTAVAAVGGFEVQIGYACAVYTGAQRTTDIKPSDVWAKMWFSPESGPREGRSEQSTSLA